MSNKLPVRGSEVLRALLEKDELTSSDFASSSDVTSNAYNYTFKQLEEMGFIDLEEGRQNPNGGNKPNLASLTEEGRHVAEDLDEHEETIVRVQNSQDEIEALAEDIDHLRREISRAKSMTNNPGYQKYQIEQRLDQLEEQTGDLADRLSMLSPQEWDHRGMVLGKIRTVLAEELGKSVRMCGRCATPTVVKVEADGTQTCTDCGSEV